MKSLRQYLRSLVTGNGSEVVLPWFPEAKATTPGLRLIRESRLEPEGIRWLQIPLATAIWFSLSFWLSLQMCFLRGPQTVEAFKVSRLMQFLHMWELAWCRNVSPLDYHECQFFKPEFRQQAEYFIPAVRHGRLSASLNAGCPTEELDHKLRGYLALKAAGLPTIDILEIFHPDGRREFGRDDAALRPFLGKDLFVKPVNNYGGRLVERWTYDPESAAYANGETRIPKDELWDYLSKQAAEFCQEYPKKNARLVQPLLLNHPDLMPLSRESLNTLRVTTVQFPDGRVELFYSELRMGLSDYVSDTGRCGIGAVLELATGRLQAGISIRDFYVRYPQHPDTGGQIDGTPFPMWDAVQALTLRAHRKFPQHPLIGWDIAVTPDGPLIVEANCNPNMIVPQVGLNFPMAKSVFVETYWAWKGE